MKLEKGMYVRTKNGIIFKYYPCRNNEYDEELNIYSEWDDDGRNYDCYTIANASYNIIDLIDKGDYVNDYKILEIVKEFKVIVDKLELNTRDGNYYLKQFTNNEIKTIVTKEVFKANEYRMETD
mgnify:FL=1